MSPVTGSKQSKPRRALYQGASNFISPSLNASANKKSELSRSGKLQHKDLMGSRKKPTKFMPLVEEEGKPDSARGETRILAS